MKTVRELANECSVYVPFDDEAVRILYADDDEECFYGEGEETGESYTIKYSEASATEDLWYKLVLVNE